MTHIVESGDLRREQQSRVFLERIAISIWRALVAVADMLYLWQTRIEERRLLASMDDRLLRDIGISRYDATREADKGFWRP